MSFEIDKLEIEIRDLKDDIIQKNLEYAFTGTKIMVVDLHYQYYDYYINILY